MKMHAAYIRAFKMQHFTKNAWIAAWPWRDCKNGPKKPKRYRNKPKKNDIVVENTTMAKISCSGANGGNDVKSTTFLYKNTLKNHSFYANMKAVEMTKIKT